jgi:serine protease AprX
MSDDYTQACREHVRRRLGTDFESKASADLCTALAAPEITARAEKAGATPPGAALVIELETPARPASSLADAVKRMRGSAPWIEALDRTRAALREVADEDLERGAGMLVHPAGVLREVYIRDTRERCFRAMGPFRDHLQRRETATSANGLLPTQVCWLNQTIRTSVPAAVVAEMAADGLISRIDVPRRLMREIGATGTVVGAVGHRESRHHGGRGVVVAVIDSEVAHRHPAFQDRVIQKKNFTSEPWGTPDRHGTAVAGIIAARGDLSGMAPEAVIYNYKVLGSTDARDADDFDLAHAIQRALEDGVRIANVSLGTRAVTNGASREVRACNNAWAKGMAIVKSAGNNGPHEGTITCPGDAEGIIVVGATGRTGKGVQRYSSRGPTANGLARPHLVAPGGTEERGIDSCQVNGEPFGDCGRGTTLAAPHVSGLLALLLEENPGLLPDEQRDLLIRICTPLSGNENVQGRGLVSLANLPPAPPPVV